MSERATKGGVFYRHDADAEERRLERNDLPTDGYMDAFDWAICQVDTRLGGYVEVRNPAGEVIRTHNPERTDAPTAKLPPLGPAPKRGKRR